MVEKTGGWCQAREPRGIRPGWPGRAEARSGAPRARHRGGKQGGPPVAGAGRRPTSGREFPAGARPAVSDAQPTAGAGGPGPRGAPGGRAPRIWPIAVGSATVAITRIRPRSGARQHAERELAPHEGGPRPVARGRQGVHRGRHGPGPSPTPAGRHRPGRPLASARPAGHVDAGTGRAPRITPEASRIGRRSDLRSGLLSGA
jgi:hypothetical protein